MAYNNLTDDKLVDLVLGGDRQAFREVVDRYKGLVARTVKGMLGDNVYAEDIGQETFVRLYRSLPEFRGEAKLSTYINRIAVNLTLNEIKRRKRAAGSLVSATDDETRMLEVTGEDDHKSRDLKEVVQYALAKIDPKFRVVLVMRILEGYSTKETAEVLGIPEGTVLSRLSRAQEQLRVILKSKL